MAIFKSGDYKLTFDAELDSHLREQQQDYMHKDTSRLVYILGLRMVYISVYNNGSHKTGFKLIVNNVYSFFQEYR